MHGKNGTWIIHGSTKKITVCSSTFYGVNSNFYCVGSKNNCSHRNFSSATMYRFFRVFLKSVAALLEKKLNKKLKNVLNKSYRRIGTNC